jgi:membrane protease YdiL (CAAX protease family)
VFGKSVRADEGERSQALPGDELIPVPIASITHAITIQRPRREVWPWLAQMGAGRAGWYSYDFIDNGGRPSATRVREELQQIEIGMVFPALPGVTDTFAVLQFEPERSLVLGWRPDPHQEPITTWSLVLEEPRPGVTRLIERGRVRSPYRPYKLPEWLARPLGRAAHAIMVRHHLLGLAARAEGLGADPAERSRFNRLFYRHSRPTWLGHWVSQVFCWGARAGLTPRSWISLEVRDRLSGRMRADAVVTPTVAGKRYVVSMFGTVSDWVHNLEAAHGDGDFARRLRSCTARPGASGGTGTHTARVRSGRVERPQASPGARGSAACRFRGDCDAVSRVSDRGACTGGPLMTNWRRRAVLLYFALVFLISGGGILLVVGPGGPPPDPQEFASLGVWVYIGILAGPSVAGVLMIALTDGRQGLRAFRQRLVRWRVGWTAYALALVPALVMAATSLLPALVSPEFRPALLDSTDQAGLVVAAVGPSILFGIFEEIGWTGFAVPQLRSRHGIVATGLIIGVVWGAWHAPMFMEGDSFSGALPLAVLLAKLFTWLLVYRVLMVWMYDRSGSLPVVMLMHAALVATTVILSPTALTGARLLISLLVQAAALWLLLLAATVATRRRVATPALQTKLV